MKAIEEALKKYIESEDAEVRQLASFILNNNKRIDVLDFYDEILKHIFFDKELHQDIISVMNQKIPNKYKEEYKEFFDDSKNEEKFLNFVNFYPENIIVLLFEPNYKRICIERICNENVVELQNNLREEETIHWIYFRNVVPPEYDDEKKETKKIEVKKSSELVKRKDKVVYLDEFTRVDLKHKKIEILNIRGTVLEEFAIHSSYAGYMDYYVKYLNMINNGGKVLFEDFKAKFLNLKYVLLNIEEIQKTLEADDCIDEIITDMFMSSLDIEYMINHYKEYTAYFAQLTSKIRYLKYKYNLEKRLRDLLIQGINVDKFAEFSDRLKKGPLKDILDDKKLLQLYKQISDKGGKNFNLESSLKLIERIQNQSQFMEVINMVDKSKVVPLLRNMILNKNSFEEFYNDYRVQKRSPGLPKEVVRDSQGRIQLRGTNYFAIEYDVNYNATRSRIVFSNGQVLYVDKVNIKSRYNDIFKDIMKKEVLCAKLAKQFKINSSTYHIALYEDNQALAMEEPQYDENGNLILGQDMLANKNEMDVNNILAQTTEFLEKNSISETQINNLKIEFLKMVLFDKLVNQASRSNTDWAIVLSKKDVRFAPLFNNSNAFNLPNNTQSKKVAEALEKNAKMVNELNGKNKNYVMSIKGEESLNAFLAEIFSNYPELENFIRTNIHLIDLDKAASEILKESGLYIDVSKYMRQFILNVKEVQDFIKEKDLEKSRGKLQEAAEEITDTKQTLSKDKHKLENNSQRQEKDAGKEKTRNMTEEDE